MTPVTGVIPQARSSWADYKELTKPRIASMALVTVAVGFLMGAAPAIPILPALHVLIGAWLVAAGGSVLNHWLESHVDARMNRTRNRPLPTGRIAQTRALIFGISLTLGGVAYLATTLNSPAAAIVAAATAALYVAVYTPLKRITVWNTVIGAVPGALPPVIGWAAARGDVNAPGAWALFAVLFAWQMPHFFAIAWMHREDYGQGGMKMLPVVDTTGGVRTGRATVLWAIFLLLAGLIPFFVQEAGWIYAIGAFASGIWFLSRCLRFAQDRTFHTARSVLRGSLIYLLAVMALLVADGVAPRYLLGTN
jgi:protoheme IX farnesyltransferase